MDNTEVVRLTMGACMQELLRDYGYDVPALKICDHMINDLISLLILQGYININQAEEAEETVEEKK